MVNFGDYLMGDQVLHPRARTSASGPKHVSTSGPGGASSAPGFHRAVRLALAVGVVAAGLCLVLGMTVLAVTIGTSAAVPAEADAAGRAFQPFNEGAAARPGSSSGQDETRFHRATLPPVGRTIATVHGGATAPSLTVFPVATPGTWGLSWVLRCQAGATGHLIVTEGAGPSAYAFEIDASGRSAGGTSWHTRDPGRHSLTITSTCSWSIRILLAKTEADR